MCEIIFINTAISNVQSTQFYDTINQFLLSKIAENWRCLINNTSIYTLKKNKARFFNLRNKNDFNNINDQQDIINFIQHEWTRKAVIYVSPNK